ncbi:MAG TPA: 16S rRNA (cytosine(967)-C(5))-methyltransferase RsmB, partial [Candidatus Polarisedimenticolia bacterium]|nr:16S rRNA (cytosine(967)-C(5))-methyltransferase RsmB [Candidatus Polarisedimenticolia bacterium]
ELVYGVLRRRTTLDRIIGRLASRELAAIEPQILDILRLSLYQFVYLTRVPVPAAVNEAVSLARARCGEPAAAFVNGVLRTAARRLADGGLVPPPQAPDAAGASGLPTDLEEVHSFPSFLVRRFVTRYGRAGASDLMAALNRPAPVVLRPAAPGGGLDLIRRLAEEGIRATPSPWLPEAVRVERGQVQHSAAFRQGAFYIQDEASQMVALLLRPLQAGEGFLDLCAAPGGKFLALAAARPADPGPLVAADLSRERLQRMRRNALRLGTGPFHSVVSDATRPALRRRFGRVLLDAPCSGTGIIRRHPEIRWRRSEEEIARLAERQGEMLRAACDLVTPGGRLVYAVCSLEPEEGPDRVAELVAARRDIDLLDARALLPHVAQRLVDRSGYLATLPHRDDLDGFFAAVLRRTSDG